MKFTIPGRLAGMNDIIASSRTHWAAGGKLKKQQTDICALALLVQRIPAIKEPIALEIYWFEQNRKRDIDNVSAGIKFILDGMVQRGTIPNDTRRWVGSITHFFPEPDPVNPRVEVKIKLLSELMEKP